MISQKCERIDTYMKKFSSIIATLALIFLLITGCSNSPSADNNNSNNGDSKAVKLDKETPSAVLNKALEIHNTKKGYSYTYMEKRDSQEYTEEGEETLNPKAAHFKNSNGNEYYYDGTNKYKLEKGNQQWAKDSSSGELISSGFVNLSNELKAAIGSKDTIPGITLDKKDGNYVISVDLKVYKDPNLTAEDFEAIKKAADTAKKEIWLDANTLEFKKYYFELSGTENGTQVEQIKQVDLKGEYKDPINIPANVKSGQ